MGEKAADLKIRSRYNHSSLIEYGEQVWSIIHAYGGTGPPKSSMLALTK
jgi:hypothetical protein